MKVSNEQIPVLAENKPNIPQNLKIEYKKGDKLPIRDPYIMPYDGKYYLYHSVGQEGIACRVSDDLENWSEAILVYKTPENFHGIADWYWAPECHYYKGKFYIFTSVTSGKYNNHRVISAYRADTPLGPFEDICDGALSPTDWDAIDGTLYIDKAGDPWLIFVHEWTSMPDHNGSMVAARLSEDITKLISEPTHMFYAKDPDWARGGITDGPYPYRTDSGKLLMIWSNFVENGYAVGLVSSESGEVEGPWKQEGLFYAKGLKEEYEMDGGHAMIFKRNDGGYSITFHTPNHRNENEFEHLAIYELLEDGDSIKIGKRLR